MSLKHAILVLLEDKPGSGYDLVQRFKSGIGHFWNSTHQQVYQELKKLHAVKLVRFDVEAQDERPDRKVYRITRAGQQIVRDWLDHPVNPPRVRDALLVKVFGAHLTDMSSMISEIDRHLELHLKQLEEYLQVEHAYFEQNEAKRRDLRLRYMTLRRGIRYEQDWIEWLEESRALLKSDGLPAKPVLQTISVARRKKP